MLKNLLRIDAEQICRLYRYLWSIEIVFRWIKDRMQLDRFISRDPTGVVRQILTALIVEGLLAIFSEGGEQSKKVVAKAPGGDSQVAIRPRTAVSAKP